MIVTALKPRSPRSRIRQNDRAAAAALRLRGRISWPTCISLALYRRGDEGGKTAPSSGSLASQSACICLISHARSCELRLGRARWRDTTLDRRDPMSTRRQRAVETGSTSAIASVARSIRRLRSATLAKLQVRYLPLSISSLPLQLEATGRSGIRSAGS
jgi:hypothetical protein